MRGTMDGGLAPELNVDSWRRWRSRWRSCGMMTAQVNTWPRRWPGMPELQTAGWGGEDGVGFGKYRCPARWACGNGPRRFVAGVQMRCRECAAEVATARLCSRCGAPIAGQPLSMANPVLADTVMADSVIGGISDAAGKGVPAGVAGQALPEPYVPERFVPGSGDSLPAELRLVLAEYVGIACGLFAGALACAAAAVFLVFFVVDPNDEWNLPWSLFALQACIGGAVAGATPLEARIRYSRLLRQPSDPHTATVTASTRGGRTLILDTTPGRYQPLSEVRLALRTKAEMLMPGETVAVYGRPDGKSPLLVSSAQRGRAFLGTETSRSTASPGPLDEKVGGATLVDWAAWAASTTFSSTGWRFGYDTAEVDAFRSAVRDTFLGGAVFWVSTPPVRSDDLRGKQFSTHRRGYDKKQADAFLEAASIRLAAMEATDRPVGPLVSSAILAGWAGWADSTTFKTGGSYDAAEVDAFREEIRNTFLGVSQPPVKADDLRGKQFPSANDEPSYDKKQVDAFLDAAGIRLAAMESTDRPPEPPVSGTVLADGPSGPTQQDFQPPRWADWAEWAEWADSTRFSTTPPGSGYDTAEVDAFRQEIRDTFLGVRQPPLTSDEANDRRFRLARRGGYDVHQVDAFCDEAEQRLAQMQRSDKRPT
jgi:DivIVA domain-containing protein